MENYNIFVTGATGFIGRYLVERLLTLEAKVKVLTRDIKRIPKEWIGKVSIIQGDIIDVDDSFIDDVQIVFHCAGEIRNPSQFYKTNVEGTKNIIQLCISNNINKFVHLSSVGVMGAGENSIVDEDRRCIPRNEYERTKYEAEKIVQEAASTHGLNVAIVRPSIVFGPGKRREEDTFFSLIRAVKNKYFHFIGSSNGIYNIVYVEDVVEALIHVAKSLPLSGNNIFILNDPLSWRDFIKRVQEILGMDYHVRTINKGLGLGLAAGCEALGILGVNLPFSFTRYNALTSQTHFSSQRIKEELGFSFLYGSRGGLHRTIKYYQSNNYC